jgi:hypothetical protein
MKLLEFILLEYKRDITIKKIGDKLAAAGQRDRNQTADAILEVLEQIDPTKNKQYVQWLANQYIKRQFRLEDASRIRDVLIRFEKSKSRLEQKDINRYDFHSLDDAMDKVFNVELTADDDENVEDAKILYKGPLGQLSVPLTQEASCKLGSGTKWCTAARENNMFDQYTKEGPLYIWKDKNGEKYQFHFGTAQFMDNQDESISHDLFMYFRNEHPVLSKLFKQGEQEIAKDPNSSFEYAAYTLEDRFPLGEPTIAKDNTYVERYIRGVLHGGRFPEYEKVLFDRGNITDMINYIEKLRDVPRIPEIEKVILAAGEPGYALNYARRVIDGPWPQAEKLIAQDAGCSLSYAARILGGRFPIGEKAIATEPFHAYDYARNVLGEPFDMGEPAIAEDPEIAVRYAKVILGAPFPEAEKAIATDPKSSLAYASEVLEKPFPAGERAMLADPKIWGLYAMRMKKFGYDVGDD